MELLLDDAYFWLNQGEVETALDKLEELMLYCEMTGLKVPQEAEELYSQALDEWLLMVPDFEERDSLQRDPSRTEGP